jgi:spermidine synthase
MFIRLVCAGALPGISTASAQAPRLTFGHNKRFYRGPFVPFHLLTKEFYQIVRDHLAEGGVMVRNVETTTMLFDSAMKTIGAVFPQIETYKTGDNVGTVAHDGPERKAEDLAAVAGERDKTYGLRYPLTEMLTDRKRVEPTEV